MLVLTRRLNESIKIGADIEIKIVEVGRNSVRLGIIAPKQVSVHRKEIYDLIQQQNILASKSDYKGLTELKGAVSLKKTK
jgi:carbon storage regulator